MKEARQLCIKIILLCFDILMLAFVIFRRVILPCRKTSGNIFSSGFTFFAGVVKKINAFEHRSFSMAAVLDLKYIRQALLLIASLLLFLSSFEWEQAGTPATRNHVNTVEASVGPAIAKEKIAYTFRYLNVPITCTTNDPRASILPASINSRSLQLIYLYTCRLLI